MRLIDYSWCQAWGKLFDFPIRHILSSSLTRDHSHCSGSAPGSKTPTYFGGANQGTDLGDGDITKFQDSTHDVLSAMIDWVEHKKAPDQIIATAWTNDRKPGEIHRQRPLCMWPKQAKYKGGDETISDNWKCEGLY